MKTASAHFSLFIIFMLIILMCGTLGCANMIPPTGGPRDSLPPVLVEALPNDSSINFKGDRITLNFNEYIEIQNVFENVIVSPTPNNIPLINYRFRTVSIRIKDTLEPNTTYSINFGNSIRDINEGNVYKNYTYLFSTGSTIDQNTVTGKVVMAETGKADSTLIVVLHRNLDDSAVVKEKPRYIARVDSSGNFQFRNLPEGIFALYALPNEFSKRYDDTTKPFAFADKPISTTEDTPLTLYAYTLEKIDTAVARKPATTNAPVKENNRNANKDKQLRYQLNLDAGRHDLLKNLELTFNRPVTAFDSTKITLAGKNYVPLTNYSIRRDTSNTIFTINYNWPPDTDFNLIIDSSAVVDSAGVSLRKNDTLKFATKRVEDYGSVKLRFNNLDYSRNPVLQIVSNENIVDSIPLTQREWYRKLYQPGDYNLRILYDANKNGKWDPGKFFGTHVQPEIVISLNTTFSVRANWDNEKDISL